MSAARHADVLFVKTKDGGENDLARFCNREGIKHLLFTDFSQVTPLVEDIVTGKKTTQEVLSLGKA